MLNANSESPTQPSVLNYLNVSEYLQDYYAWKKRKSPSFSYTLWARSLGLRSRSFLRLIVMGKRPFTDATVSRFSTGMGFSKVQREYFIDLVAYSQASAIDLKEVYFKKLLRHYVGRNKKTIVDGYDLLSSHLAPRVLMLLGCEDIDKSTSSICEYLGVSKTKMEKVLKLLESLKLASFDEAQSQWLATTLHFEVPDELGGLAHQSFHKKSLEESIQKIQIDPNQRDYRSGLFVLDEQTYKEFVNEIKVFVSQLAEKSEYQPSDTPKKIYQINCNLIPMSRDLISKEYLELPASEVIGEKNG